MKKNHEPPNKYNPGPLHTQHLINRMKIFEKQLLQVHPDSVEGQVLKSMINIIKLELERREHFEIGEYVN